MALDWNKDVSFTGLRKKKGKAKSGFPTKAYINLAIEEQRTIDARKAAILAVFLVILIALFVKFGVYDFLDRVNVKQAELNAAHRTLDGLEAQLVGYDEVKAEYDAFEAAMLVSGESLVSVTDALDLIDKHISPVAQVASISFKDDTLTLNLANTTLDQMGELVDTLYEQPIVKGASVATASSQEAASGVVAVLKITLQAGEEA